MAKLFNLARMTTATTGAGTITLGAAVPGCLTFAQAGILSGDVVSYGIADGTNSEVGIGTYTAAGTTLTRTVLASTNAGAAINLSGSAQVFIAILADSVRERLTGNRIYFVNGSSGSDTANNGLSSGAAFKTWPKAWNVISALDTAGFNVDVVVANGTYTGSGTVAGTDNNIVIDKWWVGGGKVTFQGANPTGAILSTSGGFPGFLIRDAGGGTLALKDFKFVSSGSSDHIQINAPARIEFGNIDFGAAPGAVHIRAFHPGFKLNVTSSYAISGTANSHLVLNHGVMEFGINQTVTLTGSLDFISAFLFMDVNAKLNMQSTTTFNVSGATIIGARHNLQVLCALVTGGKDKNSYLPGSTVNGQDLVNSRFDFIDASSTYK